MRLKSVTRWCSMRTKTRVWGSEGRRFKNQEETKKTLCSPASISQYANTARLHSTISRGFQYRPHVPALFHSSYRFPPFQPYPDWMDSSCIATDAAGIQTVTSGICKSAKSAAILTSVAVVSFSKASLGPREGQSAAAPCLLDLYLLSNYNPAAFPL